MHACGPILKGSRPSSGLWPRGWGPLHWVKHLKEGLILSNVVGHPQGEVAPVITFPSLNSTQKPDNKGYLSFLAHWIFICLQTLNRLTLSRHTFLKASCL